MKIKHTRAHFKICIEMSTPNAVDKVHVGLYGSRKPLTETIKFLRENYIELVKKIISKDKIGIGKHYYCLAVRNDNDGCYSVSAYKTKETVRFIPYDVVPSIQYKSRLKSCTQ